METCYLALSFHNDKVFLTLDQCSLTLVNFILTLENLGPKVNDSWDSDPCENPAMQYQFEKICKEILTHKLGCFDPTVRKVIENGCS